MKALSSMGWLGTVLLVGVAILQGCGSEATAEPTDVDAAEVKAANLCRPAYDFPAGARADTPSGEAPPVAKVSATNDGNPIPLGARPDGVRLYATHQGNFLEISKRDYSICGASLKPGAPLRLELYPGKGLDAQGLRTCASDLAPPECSVLRVYCKAGSFEVADNPDRGPSFCQIKPEVTIEARLYARDACIEGGEYCGADKITGDPNVLYRCRGGNKEPLSVDVCTNGCATRPGENDACRASGAPTFPLGPEGAIGKWADDKKVPYAGDCRLTDQADVRKMCTVLLKAREGERLYNAGDVMSEMHTVFHVKRGDNGAWTVVANLNLDAPLPF